MLLINDLQLVDSAEYFETRLKAGGVLDVAEKYPWTGEQVPYGELTSEPEITAHSQTRQPYLPDPHLQARPLSDTEFL